MPSKSSKKIPSESLRQLRQSLDRLPLRSPQRTVQICAIAGLFGVSSTTVYRGLQDFNKPRLTHRADYGKSRVLAPSELERYCELIAALKLRATNKKGRHLSTSRAIRLLEEHGIQTPQGLMKAPYGLLHKTTVDVHVRRLHLDPFHLTHEPDAVRFEADQANDCWQFDMSLPDIEFIDKPDWIDPVKGMPTLMLFSVVDNRSGVNFQEYRCVYSGDVEPALHFLFNAMAPKTDSTFPFQGRPKMIYLDNGPMAKSPAFQKIMQALEIEWRTHVRVRNDATHTAPIPKGKVARPLRMVKEAHETLHHFYKPQTEQRANEWLLRYLIRYNAQRHRSETHSRLDDWLVKLPHEGLREMCTRKQFCRFMRTPEREKVDIDGRINIDGTRYQVTPDMAGDWVVLLENLFDDVLHVEHNGKKFGPFYPVSGLIPLHPYRAIKRPKSEGLDERAKRIRTLADRLSLPVAALAGNDLHLLTPAFKGRHTATRRDRRRIVN